MAVIVLVTGDTVMMATVLSTVLLVTRFILCILMQLMSSSMMFDRVIYLLPWISHQ